MTQLPRQPREIEAESFRRIEARAGAHGLAPEVWSVMRRMIHTTADFEYLSIARVHPRAVAVGVAALRAGKAVVTDTRMLLAGVKKRLEQLGVEGLCFIDDAGVAQEAGRRGITRSAAAVERALPLMAGGIAAIGNAPTALFRLLELLREGAAPPALMVGLPVGLVGAAEAKEALMHQDIPYITAAGPKGGSAVAAAVINALAIMALET